MKINRIISQFRRDFTAEYICEHCGHKQIGDGYDDAYFHQSVIPARKCTECGKAADENYRPLATKYQDSDVI